jgi:capsular polysaccharide transport system permease protein
VLYWNPLVHAIELIRASWLPGYPVSPLISAGYLAAWALGLLVLGAAVYRAFQHRLLSN